MSAMNDLFLVRMQAELVAVLQSDEVLGVLPILDERKGSIDDDIAISLGVLNAADGGKIGACVVVQSPSADDLAPAAGGGVLETDWSFLVFEDPMLNDQAGTGHQITALQIARRIVRVVKLYEAKGLCTAMVAGKPAIQPAMTPGVPLSYMVKFRCTETSAGAMAKVVTPVITPTNVAAPQTVTITCATPGAAIYYTLDGTSPWSGNAAAVLYAAPFEVAAAATVRARGFLAGYVGSNAASATIS